MLKNSPEHHIANIEPSMPWRVSEVHTTSHYNLVVYFLDGSHGEVDMSALILSNHAGVFTSLREHKLFEKAFVENGVVTWPNGIDLAPDSMYEAIKKQGKYVLC